MRQNKRHFFLQLIIISLLPVWVSARYESLAGKMYSERYKSIDSIFLHYGLYNHDSVAAFRSLDSIAAISKSSDDGELWLEQQLLRCNYYVRGIQANESLCEPCLKQLLKKAVFENNVQIEIRVHSSLSNYYQYYSEEYGLALEHSLRAYYLARDMSVADFPNKMEIVSGLGGIYYNYGDVETAKKYMLESIAIGPSYKIWFNINVNNNLGCIYGDELKLDSAMYFYRRVLDIAKEKNSPIWATISKANIGSVYYLAEDYEKAVPLLETAIAEELRGETSQSSAAALIRLADINIKKGNYAEANTLLIQARGILTYVPDAHIYLHELFPLMAKVHSLQGNDLLAYRYADSAVIAKDSFMNSSRTLIMAKAQQHAEAEKHMAEVQNLNSERRIQLMIRNGLLIIVTLLCAIALLFVNRQKIRYQREQERVKNEKYKMETELAQASSQLKTFMQHIHEKNELIEKFTIEIEHLQAQSPGIDQQERTATLLQLQEATILTDEEWKKFKSLFEKVHSGFLTRLKEKFPELSPADVRFMALTKLNFSNKEMANVLGITTDAVRMNKYRLRKKLGLDDVQIEELAESI